jgi:hypothetical protein
MSTKKSYGGYPVSENLWKGYPALKNIVFLLKLIGWLLVISFIVLCIAWLIYIIQWSNSPIIHGFIIYGISCLISALIFFAYAELIKVFVRIEINTRKDDSRISTKMDESNQKPKILDNDNAKITYNDWKKDHPDGTLNDFYSRKK